MENPPDIAEALLRRKQLFEQLSGSPVVDVLGVVGPTGVGGGKLRGAELWTLSFTFRFWRIQGSALQTRALVVRQEVTLEDLNKFQELIGAYAVIHIRARVIGDSLFGGPEALLETFIGGDDSDSELNDCAIQLQKPVSHEDSTFGTFVLDRQVNQFTCGATWNGKPVVLNLSANTAAEVEAALRTAHSLWNTQVVWDKRIRDYAAQALLPLKNETWLDEGEVEVTESQFKERMTLESITVRPDGSFEFWHGDDDLFWGHWINITGSLSEGPTDADIPG